MNKSIRKRIARTKIPNETHSYQDDAFQLLLARFDRVDKDNSNILEKFGKHVEEDNSTFAKVHRKIDTHSVYWGLLLGLGTPLVLGVIAWFKGLFS